MARGGFGENPRTLVELLQILMCFHLTELRLEHSNKLSTIKGMGFFHAEELHSSALKCSLL